MRSLIAVLTKLALLIVPTSATAAEPVELPTTKPRGATTLTVDGKRGRDSNPGTARRPFKTVTAAWQSIPAKSELKKPVRILVRPGRYSGSRLPNYWESRWGTEKSPVVIAAAKRGTVKFGAVNLFDLRWVAFDGITFSDKFDLFHCERCEHVLLTRSKLAGSPEQLHENVKINQSRHIGMTDSTVSGAGDNAIDFVSVQYARVTGNTIARSGDWCIYAKGGSAYVTVAARTEGAGIGVNGGTNVIVSRNRLYDVGSRSHWIEVGYGSRSCDGRPGDDGRERCQQNLDAGGWGTTRVDDGTNYVRIPNKGVIITENQVDNPRTQGEQIFSIAGPYSGESQNGSGLGDVRADEGLLIRGNTIAGRGLPPGADDCAAPDCAAIAELNDLNAEPGFLNR